MQGQHLGQRGGKKCHKQYINATYAIGQMWKGMHNLLLCENCPHQSMDKD